MHKGIRISCSISALSALFLILAGQANIFIGIIFGFSVTSIAWSWYTAKLDNSLKSIVLSTKLEVLAHKEAEELHIALHNYFAGRVAKSDLIFVLNSQESNESWRNELIKQLDKNDKKAMLELINQRFENLMTYINDIEK